MSDRELLVRYAGSNDEQAFTELVERHSPMVYSVCLRVLGDEHLAEDATQTTFLVFARKARSLPSHTVLSGWLHVTARTSAQQLLRTAIRRARHEEEKRSMTLSSETDKTWNEVRPHLDATLALLPSAQREAVVLHYLRGLSRADAAREAHCPEATLQSRLAVGVAKLRTLFQRRGITLSSAGLALLLSQYAVAAAPAGLASSVRAACLGQAASPLALEAAQAVLWTFFWAKVKLAALIAACLAGAAASAVYLTQDSPAPAPRAAAIQESSAPQAVPQDQGALLARWTFENGPPTDINVLHGSWRWQPGDGQTSAAMVTAPGAFMALLPTPTPRRPFCLSAKLRLIARQGGVTPFKVLAIDGETVPASRGHRIEVAIEPGRACVGRYVFSGAYAFGFLDEKASSVVQYPEAYPAKQVACGVEGEWIVEGIELRELGREARPEDSPEIRRLLEELREHGKELPARPLRNQGQENN
jgi:RNA polymerase sigma factor (sigma-70 family)